MDNNKQEKIYKESEVTVILEDIKGQFKLLAEGQKTIRDEMRRGFQEAKKDAGDNVSVLRGEMKAGFKEMDSRFKQVFEYLSRVEDELMEIKADLKALKDKSVDKEDYLKLEKRVEALEKKLKMYKLQERAA